MFVLLACRRHSVDLLERDRGVTVRGLLGVLKKGYPDLYVLFLKKIRVFVRVGSYS